MFSNENGNENEFLLQKIGFIGFYFFNQVTSSILGKFVSIVTYLIKRVLQPRWITISFCVFLEDSLISHKYVKRGIATKISTQSKYPILFLVVSEVIWL